MGWNGVIRGGRKKGYRIRSAADPVLLTISSELAAQQAQLVGVHGRFTSEHGTPCSESHPPGFTSVKTRMVLPGTIDI